MVPGTAHRPFPTVAYDRLCDESEFDDMIISIRQSLSGIENYMKSGHTAEAVWPLLMEF